MAVDDKCACTRWAVVDAGGGLVRSFGATNSVQVTVGIYRVLFDTNVTDCAYVATIGLPGAGNPPAGEIAVASDPANPNAVRVDTYGSAGAGNPADRPFHLAVHCAPGGGGED